MEEPWRNVVTLARAYEKYGSAEGVAEAWGCSERTIRTWLHKHDEIEVQRQGRRPSWEDTEPPNHVLEDDEGYEIVESFCPVRDETGELVKIERKAVRIHRLVMVAYWGFDAVKDAEVHHRNGGKIDNRPSNLVPLDPLRHAYVGSKYRDKWD
ncbi:HNH endonuclease (plasmid) [Halorarum halophilum]|uniref:HNH endonuclease n=1 Tax=Halorarum halophilum TaxID=2743090 RepID=A0A7D5KIK5_9EURY|nr:HNH endonuclease [Halobaculum halophilum]QLG30096.1 HNH endonuclease [Halobaculum halophilum]